MVFHTISASNQPPSCCSDARCETALASFGEQRRPRVPVQAPFEIVVCIGSSGFRQCRFCGASKRPLPSTSKKMGLVSAMGRTSKRMRSPTMGASGRSPSTRTTR